MVAVMQEKLKIIHQFFKRNRIFRGMLAYSILWPIGSIVQQTFEGKRFPNYDWSRTLRFCLYGTFIQGPALYCWMRLANNMWPRSDLRSALAKALTEQFAFDPFSIAMFLYTMSILEGKTSEQAKREVSKKFLPVYTIGLVYWPITQTINFAWVRPRNQIIYVSFASLIWTTFLAYMKACAAESDEIPLISFIKGVVKSNKEIDLNIEKTNEIEQREDK